MVTSKGCPKGCLFCEAGRTPYNPRSPMTVVNEIQECVDRYDIHEIDMFDYEFLIDRKRSMAILKELQRRNLDVIWACRARVDSVDEELLREMKRAGCNRIYFGIESGVPEILERVNKGITLEQVRETIRTTKRIGIRALGFFLIGSPGETRETVRQTLKFAKELDLDYVQFSKVTAKPLTPLWKQLVEESGRDYWRDYILGLVEEQVLPRPWTQLNNEEIDRITKDAYVSYHRRPSFLLRSTFKCRSFEEFRRKFLAFVEMVFRQEGISAPDDQFVAYHDRVVEKHYYRKVSKWSLPF
jgi:anaerobic magnesium-protoporphyrin IX monomethyl ester cyclase